MPDELNRKRDLISKLGDGEGTIEEAETWLHELKGLDPLFESSSEMLSLEEVVRARRLLADSGGVKVGLSRSELLALINTIVNADTDAECMAALEVLEANVPHPAPSDIIFHNKERLTREEKLDRMLAYKPILL